MINIPEKCNRCGAPIDLDNNSSQVKCGFCGKTYFAEDNSFKVSNEVKKVIRKTKDEINNIHKTDIPIQRYSSDGISSGLKDETIDWSIRLAFAPIFLVASLIFGAFLIPTENSNTNDLANSNEAIDDSINDKNQKPASKKEMTLYRQIGISNFCLSRKAGTSFSKSMSVAANTFALTVSKKHGGYIEEIANQKLTNDQIYQGSYLQILEGGIQLCPEQVPQNEKSKFSKVIKKLNKD